MNQVGEKTLYCIYILACGDGSLYTGMTNNLARRLREHRAGRGAQWTKQRLPVQVAFALDGLAYRSAQAAERYVKSLSRTRKDALVAQKPEMMALLKKRIQRATGI